MGALTLALSRGETPDQALRWGVAAASAAVMTPATQLCEATVVRALLDQCGHIYDLSCGAHDITAQRVASATRSR